MSVRISTSEAIWEGGLKGKGTMRIGKGPFDGTYTVGSRFDKAAGTNPEELIGAAHAGCFSMALALGLEQAGFKVEHIHTIARVAVEKAEGGFRIATIDLETEGVVPGIDERGFREKAEDAKKGCPVSKALTGVEIRLAAALLRKAA